jgi:hypothetical protein
MDRVIIAAAVIVAVADAIFGRPHHPHFWWEAIPGVFAILGFAGAWLLIIIAKTIGRRLERSESYYDE